MQRVNLHHNSDLSVLVERTDGVIDGYVPAGKQAETRPVFGKTGFVLERSPDFPHVLVGGDENAQADDVLSRADAPLGDSHPSGAHFVRPKR